MLDGTITMLDGTQLSDDNTPPPKAVELSRFGGSSLLTSPPSTSRGSPDGGLSPLDATALLCTWSTSSSNVMYPFTFGVLGVAGGPALMLAAFAVNWQCTRWTVRAARRTGAKTLGDLGDHLWGAKGRLFLEGSQVLFQQLFLPVALVLSAQTTQSLLTWGCNGSAVLSFVVLGFALGMSPLSQRLQHSVGLAYVSIALILMQTVCIVWDVSATPPPRALVDGAEAGAPYSNRWEWVVGVGNGGGQHDVRYQWHNVAAALGVFIYSCLPNCIAVETQAALRHGSPLAMDRAVDASFMFYVAVYLATGLPAVLGAWGGDIPIPVTSVMRNDPAGILAKAILVYSTMLDFVLASVTVNRFLVVRHFDPSFFREDSEASAPNPALACAVTATRRRERLLRWAWFSLPSLLVATAMALLVPRLESLTGLLNSITGTTVQITAVVLCLYMAPQGAQVVDCGEEEEEEGGQGSTHELSSSSSSSHSSSSSSSSSSSKQPAVSTATSALSLRRRYAAIGTYGAALTILIFSEALYSIIFLTDYSAENFWCDVVG